MLIPNGTTPVPNAVFDTILRELKCAELKILLVIIRQTLGWEDKQNNKERKSQDWISSSQMQSKTGCSQRAISTAIETLVRKNLISVYDGYGCLLDSPNRRKGKTKLFFALTSTYEKTSASVSPQADGSVDGSANSVIPDFIGTNVDNLGKTDAKECNSRNTSANFAEDFSKICVQLAQKMRITKETLTKETSTKY